MTTTPAESLSTSCFSCGSVIAPDGYCTGCGIKAKSARDHWSESPASWVGGCCDRGIKHRRNEDAMALSTADTSRRFAVLVVCDGVSSTADSDIAALAAARRAKDVLGQIPDTDLSADMTAQAAAVNTAFLTAAEQANQAIIAATDTNNNASCTFVAAVISDDRLYYSNIGDSRVYWISDDPTQSLLLTVDDSIAQDRISLGENREVAETGPNSHTITKWLGRDALDITPKTGLLQLPGSGWVLVCSDGLWNYCSDPVELAELLHDKLTVVPTKTPTLLAEELCRWACEQGGRDNITIALARIDNIYR
ncbi:MAG: PP2C family protein-serine/threonine phosphatase [Propionibacteriaceae bacterium]